MTYGDRGFKQGPYCGGWHKDNQCKKRRFPLEDRKAVAGRRLRPAELAKVATEMELPVSADRYRPETMLSKTKRAMAFQTAATAEAKVRPLSLKAKQKQECCSVFGRGRGSDRA